MIKQINIYDLKWNYVSCYWAKTNKPDGYIEKRGIFYHKTIN